MPEYLGRKPIVFLIAGTLPIKDMPLITGVVERNGVDLTVDGHCFGGTQGTGALIGAALATTHYLGIDPPHALVAGDIGRGKGSLAIYEYLAKNLPDMLPDVLVMHYILPDMARMRSVCDAADRCKKKPLMIADAASMYAAKTAGIARRFDVFTPDLVELGFMADPEATHPAYIADHLFDADTGRVPDLIESAYHQNSAPNLLLVKGSTDYIVIEGHILETVREPNVPALEAIGGTGDTITGILAALLDAELEPHEAAIIAAKANRMAGQFVQASPATKISQIIEQLPAVFKAHLCAWSGVCCINYVK
ncbi:MAG: NAD(P)H-hydrate dehydratase [Dehalococcoidia bacterium]